MTEQGMIDRERFIEAIDTGLPVVFGFAVLDPAVQESLHGITTRILDRYGRPDLYEAFYSSLKEMIINGVKANMKQHFCLANGIHPDACAGEERLRERFRECLSGAASAGFAAAAEAHGLSIRLAILHSPKRLVALVENSRAMSAGEDLRIREKFTQALAYESIADYYLENGDESEGCGLGITMIVLMLKANGIDPHAFTIWTSLQNTTIARIEFPLAPDTALARAAAPDPERRGFRDPFTVLAIG